MINKFMTYLPLKRLHDCKDLLLLLSPNGTSTIDFDQMCDRQMTSLMHS